MCNKCRPETQKFLTSLFHSETYHRTPWPRADHLAFLSQCYLFLIHAPPWNSKFEHLLPPQNSNYLVFCTALELKKWAAAYIWPLFPSAPDPASDQIRKITFHNGISLYALSYLPPWNSIFERLLPPQNSKFWCLIPPWNSTLTEKNALCSPYSPSLRNHYSPHHANSAFL